MINPKDVWYQQELLKEMRQEAETYHQLRALQATSPQPSLWERLRVRLETLLSSEPLPPDLEVRAISEALVTSTLP